MDAMDAVGTKTTTPEYPAQTVQSTERRPKEKKHEHEGTHSPTHTKGKLFSSRRPLDIKNMHMSKTIWRPIRHIYVHLYMCACTLVNPEVANRNAHTEAFISPMRVKAKSERVNVNAFLRATIFQTIITICIGQTASSGQREVIFVNVLGGDSFMVCVIGWTSKVKGRNFMVKH